MTLDLFQALPGPNLNFAVFLGSLAAINIGNNSVVSASIACPEICLLGMTLVLGTMEI